MESVRVRGCAAGRPRGRVAGLRADSPTRVVARRLADASRRRNGPRKTPHGSTAPAAARLGYARAGQRRSRCGLEVSPASRALPDAALPGEKAGSGGEDAEAPEAGVVGE